MEKYRHAWRVSFYLETAKHGRNLILSATNEALPRDLVKLMKEAPTPPDAEAQENCVDVDITRMDGYEL